MEESMKENNPERIVILNKGVGAKYERQFFMDIQDAILKGYRIADNNARADVSMRMFKGRIGRCVLYLEGADETETQNPSENPRLKFTTLSEGVEVKGDIDSTEKSDTSLEDKIKSVSKYKELKKIAEENNLEMKEKVYNPSAVKKNLLEQVTK